MLVPHNARSYPPSPPKDKQFNQVSKFPFFFFFHTKSKYKISGLIMSPEFLGISEHEHTERVIHLEKQNTQLLYLHNNLSFLNTT